MSASASHPSVARRLALQSVALVAISLAVISGVIAVVAESRTRDRLVQTTGDKATAIADSVNAFDATARLMTDRAYRPFRQKFGPTLELEGGSLKNWGAALNNDFTEVDAFNKLTDGVATIFMRKGDDFERISTSLKKENGERAIGTNLARTHPAYPLMLEGKTYTGRAVLFGKPYMTHYEPVRNAQGAVVGILFIGFDLTAFQASIDKLVAESRFFTSGATAIIDPRGSNAEAVFVSHPTAAGKKVLEVNPQAEAMLTALRDGEASGYVREAAPLINSAIDDPWIVKRNADGAGWWIVAEVSDTEAMASHWTTIYTFWALLGLTTLGVGVGLFWLIRRSVSQPLGDLTDAVTTVAQGDLTRAFSTDRRDEIGRLVREVESMRQRFLAMMRQLRQATDSINTASA